MKMYVQNVLPSSRKQHKRKVEGEIKENTLILFLRVKTCLEIYMSKNK